jgi:hypothetical protein
MEVLNYKELGSMMESKDSAFTKSALRMRAFLSKFYTFSRSFVSGQGQNKPLKNLQIKLKEMFNETKFDGSILYITGSLAREGHFII